MAGPEPEGHSGDARLRRGQAVARTSEEGSGLDPVHRRTADGAGLRGIHAGRDQAGAEAKGGAQLSGHLYRRAQIRAADLCHDAKRDDEAPGGAVSFKLRLPGLQRQAAQARAALGHLRRNGYRGNFAIAVEAAARRTRPASRWPEKGLRRPSREGSGRAADHGRYVGASRGAARPRSRLSDARTQHADVVAGRTAAASIGDASAVQSVRGRLRPGRAVGGTTSGGHRGAAARPGPPEVVRKLALRRRARTRCRAACGLDRRRRSRRRRAGRPDHVQRPVGGPRRRAEAPVRDLTSSARPSRLPRTPRDPRGWLKLRGVTRNNLDRLDADIPLGVFTSVTGISGSGKSSLDQPIPRRGRRRRIGSAQ